MAHAVFISYAAEDKAVADAVCKHLEAAGITCWYAPRDVPYGQDFEESIVDAICASQLIILILTAFSNTSSHVKREIQNACLEDVAIPVLPFRIEDVLLNKALRYYVGSVHWLDAISPPLEGHLQNLVEHVRARLPAAAEPTTKHAAEQAPFGTSILETQASARSGAGRFENESQMPSATADVSAPSIVRTPQSGSLAPPGTKIPNYLALAILSVFCCVPMAVPAIIFATQVDGMVASGNIPGAIDASKKARMFSFLAIGLGLVALAIYLISFLLGVLSASH
jgi:hypothetical protein